jgi:branched-chain amino acid transport system permease protein
MGYFYGGLIDAIIFRLMQDWLANITLECWQFWIGLVLVIVVLIGRNRMATWTVPIRILFNQLSERIVRRGAMRSSSGREG